MPLDVLIDADAFLHARKLSLLEAMASMDEGRVCLRMTEFAARRELSMIDREVRALEARGHLTVHAVVRRSAADRLYRELKDRERNPVDKGEAEAIAWASHDGPPGIVFVSVDRAARRHAEVCRISAADLMDLVVLLVERAGLSADAARQKLAPWLDPEQQLGRPAELAPFDFDAAYAKRRVRWRT